MCTINIVETGNRIRGLRREKHMTIAELQHACGVTATAVCKWQRGDALPTVDNLVILAELFDITIDELLVKQ